MLNLSAPPPLSLYVHTPWCVKKCPYCDFNSHEIKQELNEKNYLQALLIDVEKDLPRVWGRRIQSIFIGGGTPSVLSPDFYNQLFSSLRALLQISGNAEITMEANPGTVDAKYFKYYREAGINRLSMGIQSFNDVHLKSLGRIHDGKQASEAIDTACAAGFENINLDLMFGLPLQSVEQAEKDLSHAVCFKPEHLSYYQLTIEPNTFFHAHKPDLPDDDTSWEIQKQAWGILKENGYSHYEVSAYAKPGKQCTHNINYWEFGDYLGIGAGAHSKLTDVNKKSIYRYVKEKHPRNYMENVSSDTRVISEQSLSMKELPLEFLMNAFRLNNGFSVQLFSERTGLPISIIEQPLSKAESQQLISWDINRIEPTEKGRLFLNNLLELFVPEESSRA